MSAAFALSAMAVVLGAGAAVAGAAPDVFPEADWASNPAGEIVPPADFKYPGTVVLSRNSPGPMVVTISGEADRPIPHGTGRRNMGLTYVEGGYGGGYGTVGGLSKGGREE